MCDWWCLLGNNSDQLTAIGSIATAILVGIIGFTFLVQKKQMELMKKEMELRLRPWITMDGPRPEQIILKNGDVMAYETFQKTPLQNRPDAETVVMSIPYRNGGQLVANNLKLIFLLHKTPFDRSIFETIHEEKQILPLAPNQDHYRSFVIPYSEFRKLNDQPLYVGVSISYDTEYGRAYSGIIYKIKKGANEGIDSWFT